MAPGGQGAPPPAITNSAIPVPAKLRAPSIPEVPASGGKGGDIGNLEVEQLLDLESRVSRLATMDYFELLKLEKDAKPADIKRAFYRESRTYHPDRFYRLDNETLKSQVAELYKRVTEAYHVLRDDLKRVQYAADVQGPERAQKLRFTEASEAETKAHAQRERDQQIGTTPKGRQFYQNGIADLRAERWSAAERNFKMAMTYEPANTLYKEKLEEARAGLGDGGGGGGGDSFRIR